MIANYHIPAYFLLYRSKENSWFVIWTEVSVPCAYINHYPSYQLFLSLEGEVFFLFRSRLNDILNCCQLSSLTDDYFARVISLRIRTKLFHFVFLSRLHQALCLLHLRYISTLFSDNFVCQTLTAWTDARRTATNWTASQEILLQKTLKKRKILDWDDSGLFWLFLIIIIVIQLLQGQYSRKLMCCSPIFWQVSAAFALLGTEIKIAPSTLREITIETV